ncbi:MAG TPA: hypothetical protein PLN48_09995 [Lachnospiraceae bacterium]|jgi:hypothetical protein|nr:hypothetical protein [Lachnospiraceae bacterium]
MSEIKTARQSQINHSCPYRGRKRKVVFISSPYRPESKDRGLAQKELDRNIQRASDACKLVTLFHDLPVAPHLYFPLFLNDNDPAERRQGLQFSLSLVDRADELLVCSNRITEGMLAEINEAKRIGIPVHCMGEPEDAVRRVLEAVDHEPKKCKCWEERAMSYEKN